MCSTRFAPDRGWWPRWMPRHPCRCGHSAPGGNAVDAAVAVGYALAVTHPQAGNIGGGGFMLLRTKDGKTTAIDFREMAPEQATRDMFLDDQGNPDSKKSLTSHLASGTPGSVAGFSLALENTAPCR